MAFGSKESTPSFVLTLPLDINLNEQNYLYKEFKKCGTIYNQLVSATTKMWHQRHKTHEYRALMAGHCESCSRQRGTEKPSQAAAKYDSAVWLFGKDLFTKWLNRTQSILPSTLVLAQKVASAVWTAWNAFFFSKGKVVHYKKLENVTSISGNNNATGIVLRPADLTTSIIKSTKDKKKKAIEQKYIDMYERPGTKEDEEVVIPEDAKKQMQIEIKAAVAKVKTTIGKGSLRIVYGKHEFPVVVRNPNTQTGRYQQEALKCGVKYCRITREWVRNKWKYYAQLVLEGYPPVKCDSNGVMRHPVNQGRMGLDIGTQTLAISSNDICDLRVLAPSARAQAKSLVNEIACTMRAMVRSRRATNPKYYNPDGTIKRLKRKHGQKQKRDWKYSKHYYRLRAKLRDLNRRLADIRKMEHNALANELLQHGNEFIVEDMDYKALQKRRKKTKITLKPAGHIRKSICKLYVAVLPQSLSRFLQTKLSATAAMLSR